MKVFVDSGDRDLPDQSESAGGGIVGSAGEGGAVEVSGGVYGNVSFRIQTIGARFTVGVEGGSAEVMKVFVGAGFGDFPHDSALNGAGVVCAASGCGAVEVQVRVDGDSAFRGVAIGATLAVCVDHGQTEVVKIGIDAGFGQFPNHSSVELTGCGASAIGGAIHVSGAIEAYGGVWVEAVTRGGSV